MLTQLKPIEEIIEMMGLPFSAIELHGKSIAKVPLEAFPTRRDKGKMLVVTAITPTPGGEGKSTTAVGLVQGLCKIGERACLTIRQPSLGPVFGHKGGGTGGGRATVEPSSDVNLHFTGDFHAVESAHNLLAAMTDNAVYRRLLPNFDSQGILWRRVTDAEDRALRTVVSGIGGANVNGPMREAGFDISAASEVMAAVALAKGRIDLRERLSQIVVGRTRSGETVTAADINSVGSMMVLLKDAIKPNIVQTQEGQPAVVHMGPFGNIAHGCSSILADLLAERCADYVVTEAGFGADLGFEKFMDIKVRQGAPEPSAAIIVATVKGLKWHGGAQAQDLTSPNEALVRKGGANLRHAIHIVRMFGLPAVVSINRFPSDTSEEVQAVREEAKRSGAFSCVEANGFTQGGDGMTDLAAAAVEATEARAKVRLLYEDEMTTEQKVELLGKRIYLAGKVEWSPHARRAVLRLDSEKRKFPICMAKTHLSISANSRLRGVPEGHTLRIRDLRLLAGARQIVALAGNILTLPGLPSKPNAWDIDLDDQTGDVIGI